MLDKNFIKRKIKLITEDLARLEEFRGYKLSDLSKDFIKQAAVERLLERIINRAIDINSHFIAELGKGTEKIRGYYDTFLRLVNLKVYSKKFAEKIAESARFRNILVHDYNNIDQTIVHRSIKEVLDDFKKYSKYVLSFINNKKS